MGVYVRFYTVYSTRLHSTMTGEKGGWIERMYERVCFYHVGLESCLAMSIILQPPVIGFCKSSGSLVITHA